VKVTPGGRKRRVVRQYQSPCPVTGRQVTARELEGRVYCWESAGKGWLFGLRPDLTDPQLPTSIEDAAAAKQTSDGVEAIRVGHSSTAKTVTSSLSPRMWCGTGRRDGGVSSRQPSTSLCHCDTPLIREL
jgi:hypothetical protein